MREKIKSFMKRISEAMCQHEFVQTYYHEDECTSFRYIVMSQTCAKCGKHHHLEICVPT